MRRGQINLVQALIGAGCVLLTALVTWWGSITWSKAEIAADHRREVADHERRIVKLEELPGQVQRMEAAQEAQKDSTKRMEGIAARLEAAAIRLEGRRGRSTTTREEP